MVTEELVTTNTVAIASYSASLQCARRSQNRVKSNLKRILSAVFRIAVMALIADRLVSLLVDMVFTPSEKEDEEK